MANCLNSKLSSKAQILTYIDYEVQSIIFILLYSSRVGIKKNNCFMEKLECCTRSASNVIDCDVIINNCLHLKDLKEQQKIHIFL